MHLESLPGCTLIYFLCVHGHNTNARLPVLCDNFHQKQQDVDGLHFQSSWLNCYLYCHRHYKNSTYPPHKKNPEYSACDVGKTGTSKLFNQWFCSNISNMTVSSWYKYLVLYIYVYILKDSFCSQIMKSQLWRFFLIFKKNKYFHY